jgi:hypothetical protein
MGPLFRTSLPGSAISEIAPGRNPFVSARGIQEKLDDKDAQATIVDVTLNLDKLSRGSAAVIDWDFGSEFRNQPGDSS